jgi:uncharacterized protein YbjT (DUF2867 family)
MHRILVTGATGRIGGHVLSALAARGVQACALVRDPDCAALPAHADMARGDLTLPETLDKPLEGIDTVFLVWVMPPQAAGPALARIAKHARRIVFLSAPIKTVHPFFQQPNASRERAEHIERLIEASGLEWTFLRPGMFASNALGWWAPRIRAGEAVRWPYLSVPTAPIDERDIAAVAVRTLCEEGHGGADYVLTGPQSLTQCEQIATAMSVAGRPVRIEEITPEAWRRQSSMPDNVADMLLDAWGAASGHPAFVTSTVEQLTGGPARTFLQWATDHAAEFRS